MACRIFVSQLGIEPMIPAVEVWSLNHWTAREAPEFHVLSHFHLTCEAGLITICVSQMRKQA